MSLVPFGVESFYPTPTHRISNPVRTQYQVGNTVRILIGPKTGSLGRIIVERNGNYSDFEPYCGKECIGVEVVERRTLCPELERVVTELKDHESMVHTVVRWFDDPTQLELFRDAKPKR
ncbi:hypothetical protein KA107_03815 [Candidatus Pacearchaeota archaeon]|nr:hypothetical protein [Candidatus Pacearchaeota archaeon]